MNLLFLLNHILATKKPEAAVGIDLGTTFCCVSIFKENDKEASFLQFDNGEYTYPSVAYYNEVNGKPFYMTGWEAYTHNLSNAVPGRYFFGYKRAIGLADVKELSKEKKFQDSVTYKIKKIQEGNKSKTVFLIQDENNNELGVTDPVKLSCEVLKAIKSKIEMYYTIKNLVITVPAYFSGFQVEATQAAALEAGFVKPQIQREPVAAAYAYQIKKNLSQDSKEDKILVFDLGGGTFDISVVDFLGEMIVVETHDGDNYLGGENVNDALTKYFSKILKEKKNIEVTKNKTLELRLRRFVEEFKIKLCNGYTKEDKQEHKDNFVYSGMDSIEFSLTMSKFDELNKKFYDDISAKFNDEKYGMFRKEDDGSGQPPVDKDSISKILLVGGSTRIPYIKKLLKKTFPKATIYDDINADTIVAEGACLWSANKVNMLPENMSVAILDVAPLHVGVKVDSDFFQPVLTKGTIIPGSGVMEFTTSQDGQTKVRIEISQGFRHRFSDNNYLGFCELEVAPGQRRGEPRIAVTIKMSRDGTIEVSALDKVTEKTTGVTFESSVARLDNNKIAELLKDAEKNAEADRELKEIFDLLRQLEEEIRVVQAKVSQPGISEEDKLNIEGIVNGVQKWLDDNKTTASKPDLEDKINMFRESIKSILDKQPEQVEETKQVEEEKTGGREEL
ncbi:heat shock cognate 71 kDa protein [Vairimorpha necatrix]|uniref:Heat shock cognate 71 kDa protein n=1 Tax=Vairimorpha necatrix TaxID=6039 RepID=A0AAX4J969_9MICR